MSERRRRAAAQVRATARGKAAAGVDVGDGCVGLEHVPSAGGGRAERLFWHRHLQRKEYAESGHAVEKRVSTGRGVRLRHRASIQKRSERHAKVMDADSNV